ncbi:MAG TPA: alpha-hydroxy-acid oxidizing protein, partial [Caulobacteraceae bacterium]|nr:alpha-hydroxy-acid oxidizing protein [Caulobacteraceae bacterium]
MPLETPLNLFDYEALARPRMHPAVWDYIAAGAADEITVAENRRAFDRVTIRPRMLVDVSRIDTATTVLGAPVAAPILIAPSGRHGAILPEAECATAEAATLAGVGLAVSGLSTRTLEDVAATMSGPPLWLQLYLFPERERSLALVRRAEAAGCRAIVLTVDSPRFGFKERTLRTEDDFDWPENGNLAGLPPATLPWVRGGPATWAEVDWL